MRECYRDFGRSKVFGDKSRGGLLSLFLKEYREEFGQSVSPGCGKCLNSYWNNYLNLIGMKIPEVNSKFALKKKYNGIQIGANGQPIRNGEMTDGIALELLNWHPSGKDLFDVLPADEELEEMQNIEEGTGDAGDSENTGLTLTELRIKYPEIKAKSKKEFLEQLKEEDLSKKKSSL